MTIASSSLREQQYKEGCFLLLYNSKIESLEEGRRYFYLLVEDAPFLASHELTGGIKKIVGSKRISFYLRKSSFSSFQEMGGKGEENIIFYSGKTRYSSTSE